MNLRNFLICLVFLSLSACQSWKPRNYEFVFKYHQKVGGGVSFGVLKHEFKELTNEEIDDLLKTAVIMPANTWAMLAVDLVQACRMLGKKCTYEVDVFNSVFKNILKQNAEIDRIIE